MSIAAWEMLMSSPYPDAWLGKLGALVFPSALGFVELALLAIDRLRAEAPLGMSS
jgi:hypothetical protein